jgi:hypothetical protein
VTARKEQSTMKSITNPPMARKSRSRVRPEAAGSVAAARREKMDSEDDMFGLAGGLDRNGKAA